MILGYTGTRKGMTQAQVQTVDELVDRLAPRVIGSSYQFLHGCAEGGDRQFHGIVAARGPLWLYPVLDEQRAWAKRHRRAFDILVECADLIGRNHDMADKAMAFIAAPRGFVEQKRGSGTWATMRYCKKIHRICYVVWPDGTVTPW